jgi:hypothetical protein
VCNSYRRGSRDLELRCLPPRSPPPSWVTACATACATCPRRILGRPWSLDPHCVRGGGAGRRRGYRGAPLAQPAALPSGQRRGSRRTLASRRTSASRSASSSPPSATGSSSPSSSTARSFAPAPRRQPALLPVGHAPDVSAELRGRSLARGLPLLPVVDPMCARVEKIASRVARGI